MSWREKNFIFLLVLSKTTTLSKAIQHIDSNSVIPHKKPFHEYSFKRVDEHARCCEKHAFMFLMAFHYKVILWPSC